MLFGEIYDLDASLPDGGGLINGHRFGIVVIDLSANQYTPYVIAVPTTASRVSILAKAPFTIIVDPNTANGLRDRSAALVFQMRPFDRDLFGTKIGTLDVAHQVTLRALVRNLFSGV